MRKKRRTAKQIAATRKMIRANRKAKRSSKRRRRNPVASTGAAERKRPKRRKGKRTAKRRSTGRKSSKRSSAARKAARTRARNKAKHRAAGRKAARTRKRKAPHKRYSKNSSVSKREHDEYERGGYASERKRRRRGKRRAKRRNPIAKARPRAASERRRRTTRRRRRRNPIASAAAEAPRRRKRRRARRGSKVRRRNGRFKRSSGRKRHYVKSHKRKGGHRVRRHLRNPLVEAGAIANPIQGPMEFLGGVLGVGFGFSLASLGDRLVTTHALNASGQDAPAVGQIYNSEAMDTPLWASFSTVGYKRMLAAAVAVIIPLGAAAATQKHLGLKSFFQLMAFGALGRTAGKLVDDGVAHMMSTSPLAQRLYGGEIAATAKLATATTTALPAAAPATFAGLPGGMRGPVVRTMPGYRAVPTQLPPPPPPVAVSRPIAGTQMAANPPVPQSTSVFLPGTPQQNPYGLPFNPHLVPDVERPRE